MIFEFSDEILKKAVTKADCYEINALPADAQIEYTFTIGFQWRMKKLIRLSKKQFVPMTRWNKRTLVVCILTLSLASAMSVSAIRKQVFKFISEIYEKYSAIHYEKSDQTDQFQIDNDEFEAKIPEYIPQGFELIYEVREGFVLLDYIKRSLVR